MLPGANVVNLVICMGEQLRGPVGALACVLGFLVGPFFAVIGLCQLFDALAGYSLLPVISDGVAFAAMGLIDHHVCSWRSQGDAISSIHCYHCGDGDTCRDFLQLPLIPVVVRDRPDQRRFGVAEGLTLRLDTLIAIALVFIPFSLTSIGGGSSHCRRYPARDGHCSRLGEFSRISRPFRSFARSARTRNDAGHRDRLEGGGLAWSIRGDASRFSFRRRCYAMQCSS